MEFKGQTDFCYVGMLDDICVVNKQNLLQCEGNETFTPQIHYHNAKCEIIRNNLLYFHYKFRD